VEGHRDRRGARRRGRGRRVRDGPRRGRRRPRLREQVRCAPRDRHGRRRRLHDRRDAARLEPEGPRRAAGPPGPQGEAAPAANALHATIQIVGSQQGAFTQTPVPIGGLDHEIVSPRDAATGQASGRRQHKPITFVKVMGAPTPMLLNALVNNENLPTVKIAITDGTSNTVMTIELTNASVASWTQVGDHERVSMTYQKITWTWLDGGITAEDDWATAVS
jgi:type VI secretion system secreted protein Hcp